MEAIQLSLFSGNKEQQPAKKQKKAKLGRYERIQRELEERIAKVPPGGSLYEKYLDAFKRQYQGLPSMTVKENHGGTHIHPYLNRVISAREMARLQTFPDTFVFEGSMKKAMWQIGNAVPPRLAECIGIALIPYLNDIHKQTSDVMNSRSIPVMAIQ